jgi:hypothetical protein
MMTAYDERYLAALTEDRQRRASAARMGRAGLALRRAIRAAEAAHRKALRADVRAGEARRRLTGTPTRAVVAR